MIDFKFDLTARRVRFSNSELQRNLKEYFEFNGSSYFTTIQYDEWKGKIVGSGTIIERFGSWKKALNQIGVDGGRERKYSPKELIENLETVWKENEGRPGKRQIAKFGNNISEKPYIRVWGSVFNACKQVSLFHQGKITEDELYKAKGTDSSHGENLGVFSDPDEKLEILSPTKPKVNNKLRKKILMRDSYKCVFCGRASTNSTLQVDHIIPLSIIKRLSLSETLNQAEYNLCTTCDKCNNAKSDFIQVKDIEHYFKTFSAENHPNHMVLEYLQYIKDLQNIGIL